MNIFSTFTEKPWLTTGDAIAPAVPAGDLAAAARRAALKVFLIVVGILFMLMVVAYAGRMMYQDWRPAPQIGLLWGNTAVLLLSSAMLHWALLSARRGLRDSVRLALIAAGTFTLIFLLGQMLAWRQLGAMVLGDFSNPAVGFFFMITGVHGLHMLGGLVAWCRTTLRAWSAADPRGMSASIGNCVLYWHFLLAVWLILFGLVFSGNNFQLFLQFCGII